jgi:hypothetical protein
MLRHASIAILIAAAGALGTVLLCLVALRLAVSALFALSGIQRRTLRNSQVLDW